MGAGVCRYSVVLSSGPRSPEDLWRRELNDRLRDDSVGDGPVIARDGWRLGVHLAGEQGKGSCDAGCGGLRSRGELAKLPILSTLRDSNRTTRIHSVVGKLHVNLVCSLGVL